ncbi:MAG: TonB-dependent receptor plug domain-containing protein [Prevotellaceae bacterium]|nr:TonB-dependent receptor plug domain-containing protein [Prevotellaceae bacterium]
MNRAIFQNDMLKDSFAIAITLIPCIVFAQNDERTMTSSLEGLEVVSRRTYSDVIPSQSLGGEQLQRLNSLSIADALRYFSGMQIKDYGGVGGVKTVNIRSMGSQHLGIYYDGIELGNAQNGQIDLGQFSLDNIEEVSLYNGQKSSLMQTASDYGNAGSVYIRTRQPRFAVGETRHIKGKVKYGLSNMLHLGVLYEQRITRDISASLSLGTVTSDGKYRFRYSRQNVDGSTAYDTTAVRQNGDIQSVRVEGNIYGVINRGAWNFKAYTYQSNRGIPGAIVNNVWRREERQVDSNTFFQGSFQMDVTHSYSFRVMSKYANYYTHYQNKDTTTMLVDNKYRQQEAYLSTSHALQLLPWLSASAAYDVRYSTLTADTYTCPEPFRWSHMVSFALAGTMKRFSTQASMLYTYAKDDGTTAPNGAAPVGMGMKVSRFTPALFVNYYPLSTRSFSIRGYVKNSFRMPTFNDLYYADMGSSNLLPEKAVQYDLGMLFDKHYKGIISSLHIQADGYYNTVSNKIIAYPKGQQFRWTMLNLGKVHITGADIEAAIRASVRRVDIGMRLQYTYQKAIDVTNSDNSFYKHQIPYIPLHSGSATADITWKGLTVTYSFIYTGERYSQQENIAYNRLQPWYTSDMSLSYRMPVGKTMLRTTLEVNNMFSQDYDVILNYPMPQRNFAVSVDMEI